MADERQDNAQERRNGQAGCESRETFQVIRVDDGMA